MLGLAVTYERPIDPPCCSKCGHPEQVFGSLCQDCLDELIEHQIEEIKNESK